MNNTRVERVNEIKQEKKVDTSSHEVSGARELQHHEKE